MDSTTALDAAIRGLADPIRRATLLRLAQGPATAGQLAALFSVSRPAVSRHLRVLRESEPENDPEA
jgi:DNA-binding transcriptional ArsR family regulator